MTAEEELHTLRLMYQELFNLYNQLINVSIDLIEKPETAIIPEILKDHPIILGIQDLQQFLRLSQTNYCPENYNLSEDKIIL